MRSYGTRPAGQRPPPGAVLYETMQANQQAPQQLPGPDTGPRTVRVRHNKPIPVPPKEPQPLKRHGPWCRLVHGHRNDDERKEYNREKGEYTVQYANYLREIKELEEYDLEVPALPPRPPVELTAEEEALIKAREEMHRLTQKASDLKNAVFRLEREREQAKTTIKQILREKNQEMAILLINDFISADTNLKRQQNLYAKVTRDLDYNVKMMEDYENATDDQRRAEFWEVLGMSTADAQDEVRAVRASMPVSMPQAYQPTAELDHDAQMQKLLREFSAEAARDINDALGSTTPAHPQPAQQVLPPEEPRRIPLAN